MKNYKGTILSVNDKDEVFNYLVEDGGRDRDDKICRIA